jgi:hypothetical protein
MSSSVVGRLVLLLLLPKRGEAGVDAKCVFIEGTDDMSEP